MLRPWLRHLLLGLLLHILQLWREHGKASGRRRLLLGQQLRSLLRLLRVGRNVLAHRIPLWCCRSTHVCVVYRVPFACVNEGKVANPGLRLRGLLLSLLLQLLYYHSGDEGDQCQECPRASGGCGSNPDATKHADGCARSTASTHLSGSSRRSAASGDASQGRPSGYPRSGLIPQ